MCNYWGSPPMNQPSRRPKDVSENEKIFSPLFSGFRSVLKFLSNQEFGDVVYFRRIGGGTGFFPQG